MKFTRAETVCIENIYEVNKMAFGESNLESRVSKLEKELEEMKSVLKDLYGVTHNRKVPERR